MLSEDVAELFDERPGYRLVDFEEVGLPLYRLTAVVTTLQPKSYQAIDEFVLRSVETGLASVTELAGFLGVDSDVVVQSASRLIRDDDLVEGSDGILFLTDRSRDVLSGERAMRPREHALTFHFDAVTRKPISIKELLLYAPKDLRGRGMREIRPIPVERPEPAEIDAAALEKVLALDAGRGEPLSKLLRVKEISRSVSLFMPAVALVYRRVDGDDVAVGFAVDGRMSSEHERLFAAGRGPEKLGVRNSVLASTPQPDLDLVLGDLARALPAPPPAGDLAPGAERRAEAIAKFRRSLAERHGGELSARVPSPAPAVARPQRVRMLQGYEHPALLAEALDEARNEVLLVAPAATPAILDDAMLRRIRACLERGARVCLGLRECGLPGESGPWDRLAELERRERLFTLRVLAHDHPSVLIKDRDWLVVTNFDWLSYRGDLHRPFRERGGVQIVVPQVVRGYAERLGQTLFATGDAPP